MDPSRRTAAALLSTALLLLTNGCGGPAPKASDLALPSPRLMVASKPLPDVAEGTDLYQENARCSAEYVRETGRLRSLQQYARTVTKKD